MDQKNRGIWRKRFSFLLIGAETLRRLDAGRSQAVKLWPHKVVKNPGWSKSLSSHPRPCRI